MNTTELVLIDLSSIAHPIWHMSQADPDPNHAAQQIAARVRALANGHAHVAVCCDSGRSFRHDLEKTYKANRPEQDAPLQHQIDLAKEQLADDGFPIWSVKGFEADDLIAAAAARALALDGVTVLVISADKDLLQLVGPRVRAMSARNGDLLDAEAVGQKFGVTPSQMVDYLTLVGDTSDNIKGCKGIGPQKAAGLLAKFGTLDAVYQQLEQKGGGSIGLPSSVSAALREFKACLQTTRDLITLRTDVDLPFDEILAERRPKAADTFVVDDEPEPDQDDDEVQPPPHGAVPTSTPASGAPAGNPPVASGGDSPQPSTAMAVRDRDVDVMPAPTEWERGLDPRSMRDARLLAKDLHDSRMFSAYGSPQGVLSTIMVGRELGLPAMASLRCVWNIEGKHSLSASLMAALVIKSGLAEYFEPVSFDPKQATFVTKRKGARNEVTLQHTIEMAVQAWPKSKADWQKAFDASGWGRNPTDMLVARAQARLARMVYPDLLAGLYTPEELDEIREANRAA